MKTPTPSGSATLAAIPYVDLARQHAPLKAELLAAVARVLDHGKFILGDEVSEFERQFAALCGTRYAVAVNSGSDALALALKAAGVGPGDEVITAPNSFVASASMIAVTGARPVFADVGDDYNLDPGLVERAITSRTKAILPVHLTGRAARMDAICAVAARRGLAIIEDCAQAVLAEHRGRRVGSFGTFGCFSLHPLKTLNACGDGGVLTTDDEALRDRVVLLRNLGLRTRDNCVEWSSNSRLDTVQAAMLLVKLRYLDGWTRARRTLADVYRDTLAGVEEVVVPRETEHERAVYHTFVIQAERRDELRTYLQSRGIETAIHYPTPIHLQEVAAPLGYRRGDFPVAERQASRILSLPIYPELSEAGARGVGDAIRRFYSES